MPVATHADIDAKLLVGMEVHVELATQSKMFTSAPNVAHARFDDAAPNSLCDPVVLGMPGVLPVINKRAVEMSMLVGLALGCRIAHVTKWDRKSYYYPDLPKNYQISQYDQPLCEEGALQIPISGELDAPTKTVRIIRAHLEEDAGKLMHEAPGGAPIDHSIVDLNRAGTPLLEIVTYPEIESPDEAVMFGQVLRNICRTLNVTEGNMQKGHMRFEPNINVVIERDGKQYKTPIVEIKNLNSFKALHGSIAYEYGRQVDDWLKTGRVMGAGEKSTRGWDDAKGATFLQREKEDAHDYRYFPDPDLVPVVISDQWIDQVRATIPELPMQRQQRYIANFGLNPKTARQLIDEPASANFYEDVLATGADPKRAAAVLLNYGAKRANERDTGIDQLGITPEQVHDIIALSSHDKIGSTAADALFGLCCDSNEPAERLAETHGMLQVSDTGELDGFIDQVLADPKNEKTINDIRAGKDNAIGALIGQIMKLSKGKANPKVVTGMIKEKLK